MWRCNRRDRDLPQPRLGVVLALVSLPGLQHVSDDGLEDVDGRSGRGLSRLAMPDRLDKCRVGEQALQNPNGIHGRELRSERRGAWP